MTEVQLHPSTGTVRLWNQIIEQYYDYEDRPTVEDGRIDVPDDCANRLVEEIPTMTLVDNEPEQEAAAEAETETETEAEADAEAGTEAEPAAQAETEGREDEQTAETRETRERNQDIGGEQ